MLHLESCNTHFLHLSCTLLLLPSIWGDVLHLAITKAPSPHLLLPVDCYGACAKESTSDEERQSQQSMESNALVPAATAAAAVQLVAAVQPCLHLSVMLGSKRTLRLERPSCALLMPAL